MAEFAPAIAFVLPHEGGYVNDPNDAGGETNFGISKRSYPDVDIKNLTVEQATEIYRREWWEPNEWKQFNNQRVANKVFDMAVNMGCTRAHSILQKAVADCGIPTLVDGKLGPLTVRAVNEADPFTLLESLRQRSSEHYHDLVSRRVDNAKFLKGWLTRANA